jgi:hypothetical protein
MKPDSAPMTAARRPTSRPGWHALPILLLAAGLLLAQPPSLSAQVILNTERFQLGEVDGFHLGADLAGSLQQGNSEVLDLAASGIVGMLQGRHWTRLIFGGKYLSDEDRSILDQQFAQLRYSYIISPHTRTFHFVQAQKNETLLLKSRWLVGTGIRRTLIQGEQGTVSVGTGVMGEWERLDPARVGPEDATSRDAIRVANLAVASWDFTGGARLLNIVYLQPDLGEFSDLRILNDLGLSVPITPSVRTTLSLEWRRDTRPPSTLDRDDLRLNVSLGFDIR